MATIANLRTQVAALVAAAQPRPGRPHRRTTAEGRQELARLADLADLMLGVAAVLDRLEAWAVWQPGYVPVPATTIPDALAATRLARLCAEYSTSGQHDESIEAALADFRARLAAFEASGATIGPWYAKLITPIVARNSAAQSTEQ